MADTDADRRYVALFERVRVALRADADLLLELDAAVGERLVEAQTQAIQRLFWTWRMAAEGLVDISLLGDGDPPENDWQRQVRGEAAS